MKRARFVFTGLAAVLAVSFLLPAPPAFSFNIGKSAPEVGKAAFDFTLPDTSGHDVSLSDFKGKVILLSFWSCYTDKCFTSVRIIRELLEEFHGQGLVAPTVCSEIPQAFARNGYEELLKQCGLGQSVMVDADRDIKSTYKVRRLPSTYLIGRDFVVREIVKGVDGLRGPEFREKILTLLEQVPAAAPAGGE